MTLRRMFSSAWGQAGLVRFRWLPAADLAAYATHGTDRAAIAVTGPPSLAGARPCPAPAADCLAKGNSRFAPRDQSTEPADE